MVFLTSAGGLECSGVRGFLAAAMLGLLLSAPLASAASELRINEFVVNASDDWVELVNAGNESVALGDAVLTFRHGYPGGGWQQANADLNTTLAPGGYQVYDQQEGRIGDLNESSGWLSVSYNGSMLDNVSYQAASLNASWTVVPENWSIVRVLGGVPGWQATWCVTRGAENQCPQTVETVLWPGWNLVGIYLREWVGV